MKKGARTIFMDDTINGESDEFAEDTASSAPDTGNGTSINFNDAFDKALSNRENNQSNQDDESTSEETASDAQPAETSRSSKFKAVSEERDAFRSQKEELETKYGEISERLNKYGDEETFRTVTEIYETLADPTKTTETLDLISSLPNASDIQSKLFYQALDAPENRVTAFNDILCEKFGLVADLKLEQPELESVMTFVAAKLSADKQEFLEFVKDEVELTDFKPSESLLQKQLREANEKLERIEKGKTEPAAEHSEPQNYQEAVERFTKIFVDFETKHHDEVMPQVYTDFGFNDKPTDAPDIRESKQLVREMIRQNASLAIQNTQVGKQAAVYLGKNLADPSKIPTFRLIENNYRRAMKAHGENVAKKITALFAGTQPARNNNINTPPKTSNTRSTLPANPSTNGSGDFSSLFDAAVASRQ